VLDLALIVIMQDFLYKYLVFGVSLSVLDESWPKDTVDDYV